MNIIFRKSLAPLLVPAVILITGSSAVGENWKDRLELSTSYNDLGVSLYKLIAAENEGRNIFISPLSISIALAMIYNGAEGETAAEIEGVLRLEDRDREWINRSNGELIEDLGGPLHGVTLDIANSIWCREGLSFDPLFLDRTSSHFGAEARSLDFASPGAADIINGWVSEHTEGMIDGIVREIDPLSVLFLINAVYFKGEWKYPFDKEETREDDFHLASGDIRRVQMMHKSGRFFYKRGGCYQSVKIPYGDGRMNMYIFLPDSGVTLEDFHSRLPDGDWLSWLGPDRFSRRMGSVAIPRFRAEFGASLNPFLQCLGMKNAFDPRKADFSSMMRGGPAEAWIDEILHKAVIEVTEKGTEAAAATSVIMVGASISMEGPFVMVLDRPFFLAIRDNETGMILFMGSIADPERPERAW